MTLTLITSNNHSNENDHGLVSFSQDGGKEGYEDIDFLPKVSLKRRFVIMMIVQSQVSF